ncbi:hypothetical protein QQM79_12680 [Marinobacteraceae bacterium S3BR75-40.1]
MEINRQSSNLPPTQGPAPKAPGKEAGAASESRWRRGGSPQDRRRMPDRRRKQQAFNGPDRRRKKDRRQPKLLNPRNGQPEAIENRRGQLISTSV